MKPTRLIWQNGRMIPWQDATVHALAHGLHYGSTVFEGMRAYETDQGVAVFRLREHLKRMFDSCKMYRMQIPFSQDELECACCEVVRQNELTNCYIRPLVYRDAGGLGLVPSDHDPVGVMIAAIEWGPLLGADAQQCGADICVSSWRRLQSASNPVSAKAGGHYLTSQLISMEAKRNGYADGIAVNENGMVTEAAGANVFMVKRGKLLTPPLSCSILDGITRHSIIELARHEQLEVVECNLPRESLYTADELFLCGTAVEINPVASLDRMPIGDGKPGPVTRRLQARFGEVVRGRCERNIDWLTFIREARPAVTAHATASQTLVAE